MNYEEIKKQAKEIMDNFVGALGKIKIEDAFVERKECMRQETNTSEPDFDFRNIMLKNAPKTKDSCIVGEKRGWEE